MSEAVRTDAVREAVEAALPQWLPRQRWYSAGAEVQSVRCETLTPIGEDGVMFCVALVRAADGVEVRYNVPLAVGRPDRRPSDPGAILHEDAELLVCDALASAATAWPLWRIIAAGETVQVGDGELHGESAGLDAGIEDINPLVREQSNSSLVAGNDHLLKVMRKVVFEPSVELEMSRALQVGGFENVAAAEGWVHYRRDGEEHPALLGLVQRFLHNSTEGWTLALTSLRDLYADAEEHGFGGAAERVQAVEDQGSSFTPDAARLGDLTARMHLVLSTAQGDDLSPVPISGAMLQRWVTEILGELDDLGRTGGERVGAIAEHMPSLRARVEAVQSVAAAGAAIRVHGDYHLGQVLRTDRGWTVLDFEGEPLRSVQERRQRQSPMRDVAGMLRSFDYAAAVALAERGVAPGSEEWTRLAPQGRSWATANREAFWAAYLERTAGTPLLPDAGAALTIRRAFEIAKAVYEVRYELAHRPQWVPIPLGFLLEAAP